MGGGVERWILNTIKGKPDDLNITVIKSGYYDQQRFKNISVDQKKIDVVNIDFVENKFNFLRKSKFLSFIVDNILMPFSIIFFAKSYKRKFAKYKFETVYLTKNQYWKLFKGTKIVGSNHTEFSNDGLIGLLKSKLFSAGIIYRGISYFHIFPGRAKVQRNIEKRSKIIVLPNGTLDMNCVKIQDNKVRFLFVGRTEVIKGIDIVLEAWKTLDHIDMELTVVGQGSFNIEDYRSVKDVEFTGIVSDEMLNNIYCKSDVFLYPTRWDSFPMTIIEAMSASCFIVTSTVIENAFVGAKSRNIISFINPDVESLVESVKEIMTHREELKQKMMLSKKYFNENFQLDTINKKLFQFLREIGTS
jgi:glycosyltransferase involved in cell wall biosynthesis